jgi:hypothetical protein
VQGAVEWSDGRRKGGVGAEMGGAGSGETEGGLGWGGTERRQLLLQYEWLESGVENEESRAKPNN